MYKVYSRKRLFWYYCLQLSFVYKAVSQVFFNFFAWSISKAFIRVPQEIKLISGTWWTFPRTSWLKLKISKTETRLCRWKSTDDNNINIFLSLENPCVFPLVKKTPENAFLTIAVCYCKIEQKSKLCHQNNNKLAI